MCDICEKLEAQLAALKEDRDHWKSVAEKRLRVMQDMDAIMKADIVVSTYEAERNEVYRDLLEQHGLLKEGDV